MTSYARNAETINQFTFYVISKILLICTLYLMQAFTTLCERYDIWKNEEQPGRTLYPYSFKIDGSLFTMVTGNAEEEEGKTENEI